MTQPIHKGPHAWSSHLPLLRQFANTPSHYPLEVSEDMMKLFEEQKAKNQTYQLSISTEEKVKENKNLTLEGHMAVRVHDLIYKLRAANNICKRPIAHVTVKNKPLNTSYDAVWVMVTDIRKREKKQVNIRVYYAVCKVRDQCFALYRKNFQTATFIDSRNWLFRLLNGENCGQVIQGQETARTKEVFGEQISTISVKWAPSKSFGKNVERLSYKASFNAKGEITSVTPPPPSAPAVRQAILDQPFKSMPFKTTPEIQKGLEKLSNQTHALFILFSKGKPQTAWSSELYVVLLMHKCISFFKQLDFISKRPITNFTAHFQEENTSYQGVCIELSDTRDKLWQHHSIWLVGKKQMLLFNFDPVRVRIIDESEYIHRLVEGRGNGQLIWPDRKIKRSNKTGGWFFATETARMKRRGGWFSPKESVVSIKKIKDASVEELSYGFLIDDINHVWRNGRCIAYLPPAAKTWNKLPASTLKQRYSYIKEEEVLEKKEKKQSDPFTVSTTMPTFENPRSPQPNDDGEDDEKTLLIDNSNLNALGL